MIIINLKGGLGNQLFQYAAGRALALHQQEKNGKITDMKLDITGYERTKNSDTPRRYSLSPFNIKAEIATREEIIKLKYPLGIISKGWRFFRARVLRQFNTSFVLMFLILQDLYISTAFSKRRNIFWTKKKKSGMT